MERLMVAFGFALLWIGYTTGLYGYILIKGYNVTFKEMFSSTWPPPSKTEGSN
jgi:hypothetical protein